MTTNKLLRLALAASAVAWHAAYETADGAEPDWSRSIVQISMARSMHDVTQPWIKQHNAGGMRGVVIGKREIVTLAVGLDNLTLLRVQKSGRGRWWDARVKNNDVHSGLGIITVDDDAFWTDMEAAPLAETVPKDGEVLIYRWEEGQLKQSNARIKGLVVTRAAEGYVQHKKLLMSTEAGPGMAGEAVVKDGKMVGLTDSRGRTDLAAIPSDFITFVTTKVLPGKDARLGYFDLKLQRTSNPNLTRYLGLEGEPRGAVVLKVADRAANAGGLMPRDIILKIDSFDVDSMGEYKDPVYGHLSIANLATRDRLAGDTVPMEVCRDGRTEKVLYRLPASDFSAKAVPRRDEAGRPEYLIAGGALFLNLSQPYLSAQSSRAPMQLLRLIGEEAEEEQKRVVVLSKFLQDEYCLGYVQYANLIVEKVNDKAIGSLRDVATAMESPVQGKFHVIEFARNTQRQRIVLGAADMPAATARILARYNIPQDRYLAP